MRFDVVIAGGGPAGLSAALILGRCLRRVLVCDENQQRNRASQAIHGLLGREGKSPAAFLDGARQELARYETVELKMTRVVDQVRRAGFRLRLRRWQQRDGREGFARYRACRRT